MDMKDFMDRGRRILTRIALVVLIPVSCSTATLHPELVAKAAKVRVVRNSSEVQGCQFLQSVTATEEPGFTHRSGVVIDPGTPAITLLQLHAAGYGADTVEITSEERSYRAAVGSYEGRAQTLTTLTGSAYRCGDSQRQQVQPPVAAGEQENSSRQPDAATPSLFGKWKLWDQFERGAIVVESASLLRDRDRTYNPMLIFWCNDRRLTAGLGVFGAVNTKMQVGFDDLPPTAIECIRVSDVLLTFPAPDSLADQLRIHDRVTISLDTPDGPVALGFDIRGFSEAAKPIARACTTR